MAEGYGMQVNEVQAMLQDAHSTNFAENKEFFLNQNNPSNFERTWKNISFVYRELGLIDAPVRFERPAAMLRVPGSIASRTLTGGDENLHRLAMAFLAQQAAGPSIVPRVRATMQQHQEGIRF